MSKNDDAKGVRFRKIAAVTGALFFTGATLTGAILVPDNSDLSNKLILNQHISDPSIFPAEIFGHIINGDLALLMPSQSICSGKKDKNPAGNDDAQHNDATNNKIMKELSESGSGEIIYYNLGCGIGAMLLD